MGANVAKVVEMMSQSYPDWGWQKDGTGGVEGVTKGAYASITPEDDGTYRAMYGTGDGFWDGTGDLPTSNVGYGATPQAAFEDAQKK